MTWFSGGEEGGSCRQKSTNEAFRKLIPVNTGVGGGVGGFWFITGFSWGEEGHHFLAKEYKGEFMLIFRTAASI